MHKFRSKILLGLEAVKKLLLFDDLPVPAPTPGPSPEIPKTTPFVAGTQPIATESSGSSYAVTGKLPIKIAPIRKDRLFRLENGYYDRPLPNQPSQKKALPSPSPIKNLLIGRCRKASS